MDILSAKLNSVGVPVSRYANYIYDKNGNLISAGESLPGISWYNTAWTNRKQITIDRTKVSGAAVLADFPLLISMTDPELKTVANGGLVGKSDGADILFTSADGTTKIPHEIEKYDGVNGILVAWVKIPALSSAADAKIIIYYGNASATSQQDAANVFNSNFKGVWHLKESPITAAPQMKDTTPNANHATACCSMLSTNRIAAKIDYGTSFDGIDDYLSSPSSASLTIPGNLTISAWAYRNTATTTDVIADYTGSAETEDTNHLYKFYLDSSSKLNLEWENGAGTNVVVTSSVAVSSPTGSWKHYAVTRDNVSKQVKFFVNGAQLGTTQTYTTEATGGTTAILNLGRDGSGYTDYFDGKLDEIEISDSVRTPDWIKTEFNNQNSPSTFYAVSGLVNTWDYQNRLIKTVLGKTTVSYTYDPEVQRVKYIVGATTTIYPSKYYNIKGTEKTKHIFAGDQLIATISGTGATAVVHTVATDHLTGSNVVTNSSGTIEELMDYYPYGDIRLDEKAGSFSEQRKYAGHELDVDTGLSYMNARYYNGKIGRFVSQDPLVVNNPERLLQDPQSLNYYAYSRNNPIVNVDPTGNFSINAYLALFIPYG